MFVFGLPTRLFMLVVDPEFVWCNILSFPEIVDFATLPPLLINWLLFWLWIWFERRACWSRLLPSMWARRSSISCYILNCFSYSISVRPAPILLIEFLFIIFCRPFWPLLAAIEPLWCELLLYLMPFFRSWLYIWERPLSLRLSIGSTCETDPEKSCIMLF